MGRRRRHRFRKGNEKYTCSAGKHVAEAREWASNLDLRAENVRKACLSFSSPQRLSVSTSTCLQTPHSSPTMPWNLWARSSDNVFIKLAIPPKSFFAIVGLVGHEKWREQNHRHFAHHIPPHHVLGISNGMSSFAGQWDSALKGSSASEHMLQGRWASSCPTVRINMWSIFSGTCGNSLTASKHIF